MSTVRRAYYLACGASEDAARAFMLQRDATLEAMQAYAVEVGGAGATAAYDSRGMVGVCGVECMPPGWRAVTRPPLGVVWCPASARTKAGRAAAICLDRLRLLTLRDLTRGMGLAVVSVPCPERANATVEHYAGLCRAVTADGVRYLLDVPYIDAPQDPPGARRLRASEYHAIIEAAEDWHETQGRAGGGA